MSFFHKYLNVVIFIIMLFDMNKISLKEAINNDSGRTSSKKLIGMITSVICLLLILVLTLFYFFNTDQSSVILQLYDKIIMIFGISAGLMGVKSVANAVSARHVPTNSNIQPAEVQQEPEIEVKSENSDKAIAETEEVEDP